MIGRGKLFGQVPHLGLAVPGWSTVSVPINGLANQDENESAACLAR